MGENKIIEYKEPIYFHIPAIFDAKYLFPIDNSFYFLIQIMKKNNINFAVYGCPMSCTWNGGRLMFEPTYTISALREIFNSYINILNMDIQLTLTNYFITETDLYDRLGNAILKLANEFSDRIEIMVASNILENYIRDKYPSLRLVRSLVNITKPTEKDYEKYSKIVLHKRYNHDIEYIKSVKNLEKLELLCDESCVIDCPRLRSHYETYNIAQMFEEPEDPTYCTHGSHDSFCYNEWMILPEEINDYIDLGIRHFKIRGRECNMLMIESLKKYVIRENEIPNFNLYAYKKLHDRL